MVLRLHRIHAQRTQPLNSSHRICSPAMLDERHLLEERSERLGLLVSQELTEEQIGTFEIHLDGDNDYAPDKGHILDHTVVEEHRLEGKREAGRHQGVAFLERVGPRHVREGLLDGLDGLEAVVHCEGHEGGVFLHAEVGGGEAKDGVH